MQQQTSSSPQLTFSPHLIFVLFILTLSAFQCIHTSDLHRPVSIPIDNVIFPPCPPEIAIALKDTLGITKFWNLWNNTYSTETGTNSHSPCTIFAVDDGGLQGQAYRRLQSDPRAANEFLSNHIVVGPIPIGNIVDSNKAMTALGGLLLTGTAIGDGLYINGAKVERSDVLLPSGGNLNVIARPLCCIPDLPEVTGQSNYTIKARRLTVAQSKADSNGSITRYLYQSPASVWSLDTLNDSSVVQVMPGLSGTTFLTLLQLADCRVPLAGKDPVTVFLPTDEAVANLPPNDLNILMANPDRLRQTLLYHIAPGTITSDVFTGNASITSVEGRQLHTDSAGNGTLKTVQGAKVILSDIIGHNGVIHIIDRFLYPIPNGTLLETMQNLANVKRFLDLIHDAGLTSLLTGKEAHTVFAPTNEALDSFLTSIQSKPDREQILKDIIVNHFVPGTVYTASWSPGHILPTVGRKTVYLQYEPNESGGFSLLPNGVTVFKSDIGATNGVIHMLNDVMPVDYLTTPETSRRTFWQNIWDTVLGLVGRPKPPPVQPTPPPEDDLVTALTKLPNAKSDLEALNLTGLIPMLQQEGPYTLFVPVDSAFEQLLRPFPDLVKENRKLAENVLKNHIVPKELYCDDLRNMKSANTVAGEILEILPSNVGCAKVDSADIIYWNITTKNGIIHLINKVLPYKEITEQSTSSEVPTYSTSKSTEESSTEETTTSVTIHETAITQEEGETSTVSPTTGFYHAPETEETSEATATPLPATSEEGLVTPEESVPSTKETEIVTTEEVRATVTSEEVTRTEVEVTVTTERLPTAQESLATEITEALTAREGLPTRTQSPVSTEASTETVTTSVTKEESLPTVTEGSTIISSEKTEISATVATQGPSTWPEVPETVTTEEKPSTVTKLIAAATETGPSTTSTEGTTTEESLPTVTESTLEESSTARSTTTTDKESSAATTTKERESSTAVTTEESTEATEIAATLTLTTGEPETTEEVTSIRAPGYILTEEEIPSTTFVPSGRGIEEGFPTPETPVIFLPENISETFTPRPSVNFTVVTKTPLTTLNDLLEELNVTTFPSLLNTSGVEESLKRRGPLTVFVPTDEAFRHVDKRVFEQILSNPQQLVRVLLYHIVPSQINGSDLPRALQVVTLAGVPSFITVHVINQKATPLVNNATISPVQYESENATVFLVNRVLTSPPEGDVFTTIAQFLKKDTMKNFITQLGFDPILTGPGPLSVFVPTEKAWQSLPPNVIEQLEANKTLLQDYILGHIVRGAVFTPAMTQGARLETLNGKSLSISHDRGHIRVNGSGIVQPDVVATNGVVHVIDTVLPIEMFAHVEEVTEGATPTTTEEATSEIVQVIIYKASSEKTTTSEEEALTQGTKTTAITEATGTKEATITSPKPLTEESPSVPEEEVTPRVSIVEDLTSTAEEVEASVTTVSTTETEEVVSETHTTAPSNATVATETQKTAETELRPTEIVTTEEQLSTTTAESPAATESPALTETSTDESELFALIPSLRKRGLTTLAKLLDSSYAPKILHLYGLFTMFAPTDKAFEQLTPERLHQLESDPQSLQQMLLYHAVPGMLPFKEITDGLQLPSVQGTNLTFNVYDGGRTKTVLGREIVQPDIRVTDGLVHIIDELIYPIPQLTLVQTIDKQFPTFSAAVNDSVNRHRLTGKDVTAFVPAESFWSGLPRPFFEDLFSNATLLNDIAMDHVCRGKIFKVGIRNGNNCTTLGGKNLLFTVTGNKYLVNSVPFVVFNIINIDGVIHVIDHSPFLQVPITATEPPTTTEAHSKSPVNHTGQLEVEHSSEHTLETESFTEETSSITAKTESSATTTFEGTATVESTESTAVTTGVSEQTEFTSTAVPEEANVTITSFAPRHSEAISEVPSTEYATTTEEASSEKPTTSVYSTVHNETISTVIKREFDESGYDIDVSDLKDFLPETTRYTACLPSSSYLRRLPTTILSRFETNDSLVTDVFVNSICPGVTLSGQFKNGFSCVTIGGKRLRVTHTNGILYCNDYQIVQPDIPTQDGVIHFIDGIIYPEHVKEITNVTEGAEFLAETSPETASTVANVSGEAAVTYKEITATEELTSTEETTVPETTPEEEHITPYTTREHTGATEVATPTALVAEITTTLSEGTTRKTEVTTGTFRTESVTHAASEVTATYTSSAIEEEIVTSNVSMESEAQVTEKEVESTPHVFTERRETETTSASVTVSEHTTESTRTPSPSYTTESEAETSTQTIGEATSSELTRGSPVHTTPALEVFTTESETLIQSNETGHTATLSATTERGRTAKELPTELTEVSATPETSTFPEETATSISSTSYTVKETEKPPQFPYSAEITTTQRGTPEVSGTTESSRTPSETIVQLLQNQFNKVGYKIDTTDLGRHLQKEHLFTACLPQSSYLLQVPSHVIDSLVANETFVTDLFLDHICVGSLNTRQISERGVIRCMSLGGEMISFSRKGDALFCNNIRIVHRDIPATDGVVHLIDGILHLDTESPVATTAVSSLAETEEQETSVTTTESATLAPNATELTPPLAYSEETPEPTETATVESTTATVNATEPEETKSTSYLANVTIKEVETETTSPGLTEIAFVTTVSPERSTEAEAVTPHSETSASLETTVVSELPELTTSTEREAQVKENVTTTYKITSDEEYSTTIPYTITERSEATTGSEASTQPSQPVPESTTESAINETIPSLIQEQFRHAGFDIDVTQLSSSLSDIQLYTAFVPDYVYLQELPTGFLQDLVTNPSAVRDVFSGQICPGAVYSSGFQSGFFTCMTISGKPLEVARVNDKYSVNGFPVVQFDIPTADGVVHLINGTFHLEETTTQRHTETELTTHTPIFNATSEWTTSSSIVEELTSSVESMTVSSSPQVTQTLQYTIESSSASTEPTATSAVNQTAGHTSTTEGATEETSVEHTKEVSTTRAVEGTSTEVQTTAAEYLTKFPEVFNLTTTSPVYSGELLPNESSTTTIVPFYPASEGRGLLSVDVFFQLIDLADVDETLSEGGPYTILAPDDAAFRHLPPQVMHDLRSNIPFLRNVILYHIIPQRVASTDLHNDYLLKTLQGQDVRCNVYGPVITVGGAKVVMPDSDSGYGILHIVNRVLYPLPNGTALDTIMPRNDTDRVQALIRNTTLPQRLREPGSYTVFIPSDRALNRLSSAVIDALERNSTFLEEFVLNHMVNGTFYTEGLTEGLELTSMGGQVLRMSMAGGLTVNGVPIVTPDISVTNGVVHIVDEILYNPLESAITHREEPTVRRDLDVLALSKLLNLTTFTNMLDKTGISGNLSELKTYTMFVPTDDAFAEMPPTQLDIIKSDPNHLQNIILYHIVPAEVLTPHVTNEMLLPTLVPSKNIKMNIYVNHRGPKYTASGSELLSANNQAKNGVVHVVNQVLYLPLGDIVETIDRCSILQTLRHIIRLSGLENDLRRGNVTLLAPNDAAFNKLPEDTMNKLIVDSATSKEFLQRHLLSGTVYTEGIFDESTITSLSKHNFYVRALKDCILLNSSAIQYPDVTSDNGVIHIIDRVL